MDGANSNSRLQSVAFLWAVVSSLKELPSAEGDTPDSLAESESVESILVRRFGVSVDMLTDDLTLPRCNISNFLIKRRIE